jgi:hypothetical protein
MSALLTLPAGGGPRWPGIGFCRGARPIHGHAGAGVSGEGRRGACEGEQVLRVAGGGAADARQGAHGAARHPRRRQEDHRRPLLPLLEAVERVQRPAPPLLRHGLAAVHVR